jgi:subtilisin family serine protease
MNLHHRVRVCSVLLAVVAALAADVAAAEAPASIPVSESETPALWFVELGSPSAARGTPRATLRAEREAFARNARGAGVKYTQRFVFETLWNGVSVAARGADLAKLSRLPGVTNIYPVIALERPDPQADNLPELFSALAMTGASSAQLAGHTGAGVKVGIIDSGIDYDHPDFGGTGTNGTTPFPNTKIVAGFDFVGDAYNADPDSPAYNPVPVADANPDDCNGHGTHVAGIAAANGLLKGVAPDALLGAYRVFGCNGSTDADVMIAAMERAFADGMQVVNLSIGAAFQWPQYPTAVAADVLAAQGVVVVCSIGNSGESGLYAATAPGLGRDVIGVASVDNTHVVLPYFEVNGSVVGYATMAFSEPAPTSGSSAIVYVGRGCLTGAGVPAGGDPYLADPSGKVALIIRGTCSFAEKAAQAIAAGATAVVIYNDIPGVLFGTLDESLGVANPIVGISQADGVFIRAQAAPVTMTWTGNSASFVNPTGGLISSFSAFGLSPDLSVKPDISAPGGYIFSTVPLEQDAYGTLSGTSMSSPHVAGAAALLLQAHPGTSPAQVATLLSNTAVPANWFGNPGLGFRDNVHRQGAGLVRIDAAIAAATTATPAKLALGESTGGPATRTLTIHNDSASAETYALAHVPALSTGPDTFAISFLTGFATASVSAASVNVPAGGMATVDVTITANAALPDRSIYGGYIELTASGGAKTRVPYAGFKGDYQSIQVLTPTAYGFPWLAQIVRSDFVNRPDGATYTMVGDDIPLLLVHLDHQSRHLRLEIFHAANGRPVHPVFHTAFREDYLPRNATEAGFFALPWDGLREHNNGNDKLKTVPDGTYQLKLSILKALGDAANPAHWETWTSPPVTIARP